MYKNLIFDLDGTLIDSASGIEDSFNKAYRAIYKQECQQSITSFIGPPIDQVLVKVNGETNIETINLFVEEFKINYDEFGYKKSILYNGVEEVLSFLMANKLKVFIATNKRSKPTKLILNHLSINQYFLEVVCPDSFEVKFKNKTELITNLIQRRNLITNETLMIGDTIHDGKAANSNQLDFALAEYGYGSHDNCSFRLNNLKQLLHIL
jgi:phosphoglycolate phosphatase